MLEGNGDRQVQDASVQAKGREKSIKLIGNVVGEEREHPADIAHARYLKKICKSVDKTICVILLESKAKLPRENNR